jgi:hypothetical protein
MEAKTNAMQAELELTLIRKIMEDSRRTAVDNGKQYILWGLLVSMALITNYIMALMKIAMKYSGMMWIVSMALGILIAFIMERMDKRKRSSNTLAGKMLGALWLAAGITMLLYGFLGPISKAYNPIYISPIISFVLAVAYYASSEIQQIKWFKWLALGWWLGGVYMMLLPSVHTLLINAIMLIGLQAVPGYILYKKWKKDIKSL